MEKCRRLGYAIADTLVYGQGGDKKGSAGQKSDRGRDSERTGAKMISLIDENNWDDWGLTRIDEAYSDARKGKLGTRDAQSYDITRYVQNTKLWREIADGVYHPSPGIAFIVEHPVIREIFAAPFRDRVVHHFLFNMVEPWWDKRFIFDSYSCRKHKGTLFCDSAAGA